MAHHPEKSLDGRMLWRGRIYSPLPFVRSLSGTRVNAGVWGTAAFPSVYRTDVHPFAFLPHSIKWQVISSVLLLVGAAVAWTGLHQWAASILLGGGGIGVAATIAKNIAYAMRSDMESLRRPRFESGDGRLPALLQPLLATAASAASCRRLKWRCRRRRRRPAADHALRSAKRGGRW
jgi:hypothetical protein